MKDKIEEGDKWIIASPPTGSGDSKFCIFCNDFIYGKLYVTAERIDKKYAHIKCMDQVQRLK